MGDWVLSQIARCPPYPGGGATATPHPRVLAVHADREALVRFLRRLEEAAGRSFAAERLEGGVYPAGSEPEGVGKYRLSRAEGAAEETVTSAEPLAARGRGSGTSRP